MADDVSSSLLNAREAKQMCIRDRFYPILNVSAIMPATSYATVISNCRYITVYKRKLKSFLFFIFSFLRQPPFSIALAADVYKRQLKADAAVMLETISNAAESIGKLINQPS